jgi:sec-independent protein translocase protein TatB
VFDLGWSEMGIVLLIALLVLGPKEMPKLARDLGRWVGKARALAREFQRSLEDMAREAELDDVKKQIDDAGRELRRPRLAERVEREVDPDGDLRHAFDVDGADERGKTRRGAAAPAPRAADDAAATDARAPRGEAEAGGDAASVEGGARPAEERRTEPASSGAGER